MTCQHCQYLHCKVLKYKLLIPLNIINVTIYKPLNSKNDPCGDVGEEEDPAHHLHYQTCGEQTPGERNCTDMRTSVASPDGLLYLSSFL